MTAYCHTCFENFGADRPRSPDPKHCRVCFEIWQGMAPGLSDQDRTKWVPQVADVPVKPQQPLPGLQLSALIGSGAVQERKETRGRHRLFLDKQALAVISDLRLKTRVVAEMLGISKPTVANLRKNGGSRKPWCEGVKKL